MHVRCLGVQQKSYKPDAERLFHHLAKKGQGQNAGKQQQLLLEAPPCHSGVQPFLKKQERKLVSPPGPCEEKALLHRPPFELKPILSLPSTTARVSLSSGQSSHSNKNYPSKPQPWPCLIMNGISHCFQEDKIQNFFFFLATSQAGRILVPQPGIKPTPPAVEVQSLNH